MCLIYIYISSKIDDEIIILFNRDENKLRPTLPLH